MRPPTPPPPPRRDTPRAENVYSNDSPSPRHREILRREFERIAALTDGAYGEFTKTGKRIDAQDYKDWAALLLRFHQAVEQLEGKEAPPSDMPSMKASHLGEAVGEY